MIVTMQFGIRIFCLLSDLFIYLCFGDKAQLGRDADHSSHLEPRLRKSRSYVSFPPSSLRDGSGTAFCCIFRRCFIKWLRRYVYAFGLILRQYPGIRLEGLKTTTKNQGNLSPSQDLNPGLPEYEAGVLTTLPRRSVLAI
jgi:hypothetical protein